MLQKDTSTSVLDETRSTGYGMHACAVGYGDLAVHSPCIHCFVGLVHVDAASWCDACVMDAV